MYDIVVGCFERACVGSPGRFYEAKYQYQVFALVFFSDQMLAVLNGRACAGDIFDSTASHPPLHRQ